MASKITSPSSCKLQVPLKIHTWHIPRLGTCFRHSSSPNPAPKVRVLRPQRNPAKMVPELPRRQNSTSAFTWHHVIGCTHFLWSTARIQEYWVHSYFSFTPTICVQSPFYLNLFCVLMTQISSSLVMIYPTSVKISTTK